MAIARVIAENVLGCTSVAFDTHAIRSMATRAITEDEVVEVLRNPDQTGLPTQPNRQRFRKQIGARTIDVVFEQDVTQVVVITTFSR
jgi:hypothetical protein